MFAQPATKLSLLTQVCEVEQGICPLIADEPRLSSSSALRILRASAVVISVGRLNAIWRLYSAQQGGGFPSVRRLEQPCVMLCQLSIWVAVDARFARGREGGPRNVNIINGLSCHVRRIESSRWCRIHRVWDSSTGTKRATSPHEASQRSTFLIISSSS